MTKVEAIRKWAESIRSEVMPSYFDGRCCYSMDGHKCAVGILLPDDINIDQRHNSCGVFSLMNYRPDIDLNGLIEGVELWDLGHIQEIHDGAAHRGLVGEMFADQFFLGVRNLSCFSDVPESVWTEVMA